MAKEILIQLQHKQVTTGQAQAAAWLLLEHGQPVNDVMRGSLAEAAAAAEGAQVIVLVPGEEVYMARLTLPGKNRQTLLKAVPFALEDQLIDDIDAMHFALGSQEQKGQYWVAAIRREQMDQWQSMFKEVGLNPHVLVPDVMLLPPKVGGINLLLEQERALLVMPDEQRYVLDQDSLELALQPYSGNDETATVAIDCFIGDDVSEELMNLLQRLGSNAQLETKKLLSLLSQGQRHPVPVNLMQGDYSRREKRQQQLRPWYPAAAMLAVWLVAKFTMLTIDNLQLSSQLAEIQKQQAQVYQQAFPGSKQSGDLYRRMQSQLKELQQRRGQADASLYHMLSSVAPVLSKTSGLQLQALRFNQGRLDLELQLPDLQALDGLKASLNSEQKWQVDIQSASSAKGRVESRMQIRSSS